MSNKILRFVSKNKNKIIQFTRMLPEYQIVNSSIVLPQLQGDPQFIARNKVQTAYSLLNNPCIIQDSALCFNALKGMPGPYVASFLRIQGPKGLWKLLNAFDDKTAYSQCTIGYKDGDREELFVGRVEGTIVYPRKREARGFGFDSIFEPKGYNQTFGEMEPEEKDKLSARFLAIEQLKEFLNRIDSGSS